MLSAAAEQTLNLTCDKNVSVLLEATFLVDEYVTKADILLRKNRGWQLIEVKSSVKDRPESVDTPFLTDTRARFESIYG